jgi:hypothetical protein
MTHLRNFPLKAAPGRAARSHENGTTVRIVSLLATRLIPTDASRRAAIVPVAGSGGKAADIVEHARGNASIRTSAVGSAAKTGLGKGA